MRMMAQFHGTERNPAKVADRTFLDVICKQVSEALVHMPAMQKSNLQLSPAISIAAWSQFAKFIPFHQYSEVVCARTRVGLTDCAGLVRPKETLKRLVTLNLGFVRDQQILQGDPFDKWYGLQGLQIRHHFS